MIKETDEFDDLFRTKLKDLEADTSPGDWEAIVARLPRRRHRPAWRYAAAIATLLLFTAGGGWYWWNQERNNAYHADIEYSSDTEIRDDNIHISTEEPENPTTAIQTTTERINPPSHFIAKTNPEPTPKSAPTLIIIERAKIPTLQAPNPPAIQSQQAALGLLIADAAIVGAVSTKKTARASHKKWTFGTGLGGLSGGTTNLAPTYLLRSSTIEDCDLLKLNAPANFNSAATPKTKIDHKMPLSFGVTVNRNLNSRWALSTGLVYTLLRSEWDTEGEYSTETKQYLHFAGIPLAITYKIAEWQKLTFYASAGGMGEINFAGQEKTSFYAGAENQLETGYKPVRMKELHWSLSARAGASYPLLRYLGIFAEMGASYHFNNGSSIETVYSRKPWNVSPLIGLRLGF